MDRNICGNDLGLGDLKKCRLAEDWCEWVPLSLATRHMDDDGVPQYAG